MARLRIAYLTSIYPRASDTFVRGEAEQLRRLGFEVDPFAVRKPAADQLVADDLRAEAARTTYLFDTAKLRLIGATLGMAIRRPVRFVGACRLAWRTGMKGIAARLRQVAYVMEAALLAHALTRRGIRHLHNHIGESSATVAMLASHLSGVGYSSTFHGPSVFFNARASAIGDKVARSRFTVCITDFCRSQCMIFTAPEHWTKLKVIRCGLDERFLDAPQTPIPDAPRLVAVGRLCPEKGQVLLIEAAGRLAEQGVDFTLELIGDGLSRAESEQAIERCGLRDRVKLLGWCSSEQVRARLEAARAFVLPSLAEGLPVSIMEALALGRPVISTRIAGIPELVRPDETGWLVAPSSIDELAQAMHEAITASPERLQEMGRRGAAIVRERHDAAKEAARLARLIESAIDSRDPAVDTTDD